MSERQTPFAISLLFIVYKRVEIGIRPAGFCIKPEGSASSSLSVIRKLYALVSVSGADSDGGTGGTCHGQISKFKFLENNGLF